MAGRVLIIDDDPWVLDVLRLQLEAWNLEVAEACDGAEGVAVLSEGPFDAILSDLDMPGADGWEVAKRAGETWPGAVVAILSGRVGAAERAQAALLGVACFRKPLPSSELHSFLRAAGVLGDGSRAPAES